MRPEWGYLQTFSNENYGKGFFSKLNRIMGLGNKNFRTPVQLYHILLFKFA